MRYLTWTSLTPCAAACLIVACNSADFGGSNGSQAPAKTADCADDDPDCTSKSSPPAGTPPSSECVDGEKLKVAWTGDVKECLVDEGKTYNFDLKQCAEMRQSKFDCTWDTVKSELDERGLLTEVLKRDSESGAKLVSCGQSADGNRIVVQWVTLPEDGEVDCEQASAGASITTGCYTLYRSGEERPPTPSSEDERAQQVYDCMNEL